MSRNDNISLNLPHVDYDNSMGAVRYFMAIAVVILHFNVIFQTDIYFPLGGYGAVGGFFALSGFLVYKSYLKDTSVNGPLWTMKIEWVLYLTVPVFFLAISRLGKKRLKSKILIVLLIIYLASAIYRGGLFYLYELTGKETYNILSRQFVGQIMYFYSGIFIYFIYDNFKKYRNIIIIGGILIIVAGSFVPYFNVTLYPFFIAVLAVAFSSFRGWIRFLNKNNISYEIYLFHFPVIQIMHQYKEEIGLSTGALFLLSLIAITFLSFFSLFFVEKRFMPRSRVKGIPSG